MFTDPSGAAIARDDMAFAESLQQAAAIPPRDLAELAAAVDHLEALIAAAAGSEADACDVVERIADIAFVLHERDVEASLCDSLDAAVRDLGNADARTQANVERMRQAAELLRELSRRVNGIIARSLVAPSGAEELGEETEEMSRGEFEERGQVIVAALAEPSLPVADQAAAASDLSHELAADAGIERPETGDIARGNVESDHEVHSRCEVDRQDSPDAVGAAANAEEACSQIEATKPPEWQTFADPEDDPGDLFEPRKPPVAAPVVASAPALPESPTAPPPEALSSFEHTSMPAGKSVEPELTPPETSHSAEPDGSGAAFEAPAPPAPSPAAAPEAASPPPAPAAQGVADAAPPPAAARQAPNDPLAALRALSEEEMIALFT
jgi:hypothetical protein